MSITNTNPKRTIGFTPSASIPIPAPPTNNTNEESDILDHETKSPKSDETITNRRANVGISVVTTTIQQPQQQQQQQQGGTGKPVIITLNQQQQNTTAIATSLRGENSGSIISPNRSAEPLSANSTATNNTKDSSIKPKIPTTQPKGTSSSAVTPTTKSNNSSSNQTPNKSSASTNNTNNAPQATKDSKQPRTRSGSATTQPQNPNNSAPAQVKRTSKTSKTKTSNEKKGIQFFAHLPVPNHGKIAKHPIHPSVLTLALQYAHHGVIGSNARTLSMLAVFSRVIQQYETPENCVLSRTLETYLRPQIDFLTKARPMSVGMGNAIRELKLTITQLSPDLDDSEAKRMLISHINSYTIQRIILSAGSIASNAFPKIVNGDVILTYARSTTIEKVLGYAHQQGKQFKVVLIDSYPLREGLAMMKRLSNLGIKVKYGLLSSVGFILREVTKVFLGAHALLNNGSVYSRAGTALIAMMAFDAHIPVLVCCETYKFTERLLLDSVVLNELDNPEALSPPEGQKNHEDLVKLNLMYDVTPSEYVNGVITESGIIPVTSVPVVLRGKAKMDGGAY